MDGCPRLRFSDTSNRIALVSEFLCGISGIRSKEMIHPPDFLPPKAGRGPGFSESLRALPECFACGPGARTSRAKSIGGAGPLLTGFYRLPQDAAGRSADQPVAPTRREPFHRRFKRFARLVHEMEAASWFLPGRSLPPGRLLAFRVRPCVNHCEAFPGHRTRPMLRLNLSPVEPSGYPTGRPRPSPARS